MFGIMNILQSIDIFGYIIYISPSLSDVSSRPYLPPKMLYRPRLLRPAKRGLNPGLNILKKSKLLEVLESHDVSDSVKCMDVCLSTYRGYEEEKETRNSSYPNSTLFQKKMKRLCKHWKVQKTDRGKRLKIPGYYEKGVNVYLR